MELARRPGRSRSQLQDTIEVAADETERLIALAENLLTLARQEHEVTALDERFELMAVLRKNVLARTGPTSLTTSVTGPDVLWVRGDQHAIGRAVVNLIANAHRHARTTVTLAASTTRQEIAVTVIDDGPGFAEEFLPHAFERFTRGDDPRTRSVDHSVGSGLGLSIVRAIARGHGGEATARNRVPGPGSEVRLAWPGRDLS